MVSSHATTVAQAAVGARGCIAGTGIASLLFIYSLIHSLLHSGKLGAGIAAVAPLSVRIKLEQDGTYTWVLRVALPRT